MAMITTAFSKKYKVHKNGNGFSVTQVFNEALLRYRKFEDAYVLNNSEILGPEEWAEWKDELILAGYKVEEC